MISEALKVWRTGLKTPSDGYSFFKVKGSNVYLVKDSTGRIGLMVTDTRIPSKQVSFHNFELRYFSELEREKDKSILKGCQLLLAEKSIQEEYLLRILFGIFESRRLTKITAEDLIEELLAVKQTFEPVSREKNEIIGAWAELNFLLLMLNEAKDLASKLRVLRSWESPTGRKKIDFRFHESGIAFEMKSTTKSNRVHHFSGMEQVTIPPGFKGLYILSMRIVESQTGKSCQDICADIRKCIQNPDMLTSFEDRLVVRGSEVCLDDEFRFEPGGFSEKIRCYDVLQLSVPVPRPQTINLQWDQVMDDDLPESEGMFKELITSAIHVE